VKTVLRILAILALPLCASASGNPIADAKALAAQLNPISIALGPLIDQAAGDVNGVLEQRLIQLNGIIQLALNTLNQIAQQRIQDIDEKTRQQITEINRLVSQNLLQFNYIIGKNLNDVNTYLGNNIDKFNFGVANNIASIKLLNTVPLINVGPTGLTTFKQLGPYTEILLVGSGLKKFPEVPEVYLTGASLGNQRVKVEVPASSMGLIQLRVPNQVIPNTTSPTSFTLDLQIRDGSRLFVPTYSKQSVPLRICGALPKYAVRISFTASGKIWEYTKIQHPLSDGNDWIKVNISGGNGNSSLDVCPGLPPDGWTIDNSAPEYGVTYASETGHNYHSISRNAQGCLHLYADGRNGDAWENIGGTRIKLKRLTSVKRCNAQAISEVVDLKYEQLSQVRVDNDIQTAIGDCKAAAADATPVVQVTVDVLDVSRKTVETRDLDTNVPQTALNGALTASMDSHGLIDLKLEPSCRWSYPVAVR
jgi:hypothetical protein